MSLYNGICIGDLRHRVDIQSIVTSQNSDAGNVRNPVNFATGLPAAVNPERGRLFWQAKEQYSEVDSEIVIRYLTGVKAKMQVVFGARIFKVVTVTCPLERRRWLHLFCSEVNG